jgi:endonuclease/exonuclease/phosphatase family metal-dependent hydrolase
LRSLTSRVNGVIRTLFSGAFRLRFVIEALLVLLFMVQAIRFLVGTLYAHVASASVYPAIDPALLDPANPIPGLISPDSVQTEVVVLLVMLLLPLLALLVGRFRWTLVAAAVITLVGRALMTIPAPVGEAIAASIAVGGGLLYLVILSRQRQALLPVAMIGALAADQLLRGLGNTLDMSLTDGFAVLQQALSAVVFVLAFLNYFRPRPVDPEDRGGTITFFSALGFGALLFLQFSLLATPNAIAGRAGADYTLLAPLVFLATVLPIVPAARSLARWFISLFDGALRGWAWMLLLALLLVFGTRFQGLIAAVVLVLAQFVASLTWWWVARPRAERERSLGGLWILFGIALFGLLVVFDMFTFEYAFVREFADPLTFLNPYVPPLLRGFRGLGLIVLLLAVFFTALPMLQTRRRVPWKGGTALQSLAGIVLIAALSAYVAYAVRPPVVQAVRSTGQIRVATFNIHAGFNEFFHYDLEAIASTIQQSGANVVLLQEVEIGRMTSFSVDQTLWLARRLGMDTRFFATNESLQGLAVLSNVEIVAYDGLLLTSRGNQTGVQWVKVQPDEGEITLYNTWLGLLLEGVGDRSLTQQEQDQQRQLDELLSIVSANSGSSGALGRLVIGGTFNNVPDSDLVRQMQATGLADPFESQPPTESYTLSQTGRRARLDYLWTNMLALRAGVIDSRASDHALAVILLQIQR